MMQDLWTRLERFLAAQQWPVTLRPGASETEIAGGETALGLCFPDDFRASLQIHDGEDWQQGIRWLDNAMLLLPIAEILAEWGTQQTYYAQWGEAYADDYQDEGRIRNVVYHPPRIPIAESDADVWLWLDLTPGPTGVAGQVITNVTECEFIVLAPTFHAFLARYLELLETGVYVYEAEAYGYVIPQNLDALHSGAVRQDAFCRRLFPLTV
jgi:cell wall assembly regulator SMI1